MKVLPLSEVKTKLSGLVTDLELTEEEIIITKNGRAAAVIVSANEYESWKETIAIRSDPRMMRDIKAGLRSLKKGKGKIYTLDELFRDNT